MGKSFIVLNNVVDGRFIIPEENQKFYDPGTNTRVSAELERSILIEFEFAKFRPINKENALAETQRFVYHRNKEDEKDKIVWVDVKGEDVKPQ